MKQFYAKKTKTHFLRWASMGMLGLAACLFPMKSQAQLSTNPDKFLGNITTRYNVDAGGGVEPFYKLWNQITCENETKWDAIEGSRRGSFNFTNADKAANYAKQHGFPFKYHTLIWGAQYPSWVNNLSTEEQYKAIVEYFDAVQKHYPNLEIIDVVNEAVAGHQPAPYKAALGGDGVTGYDWIIKAFEMAHERWPNAILVYNDYNSIRWQHNEFIELVKTLRNAGAPIDAYGLQSHELTDISVSEFKTAIDNLNNQLKMPMYSTEYDIGTSNDAQQKQRYSEQIPYMWEKDYCAGITLWGYIYGATWTTDGNSGLIRDGKDRPAMTWLREYMQTDAAKNAKSPFPGMKKEASVYVKCWPLNVTKGDVVPITIRASLRTKTIDHIDVYVKNNLITTLKEAPYETEFTPTETGSFPVKVVVVATDGTEYERYSGFKAYNPRESFKEVIEIPGTLQAENFDKGAEGITYHDSDSNNEGTTAYRTDSEGVDIVTGNGGYAIGYTSSGEWLEYTVNVKEAGIYSYDATVSSGANNSSISLSLSTKEGLTPLTDVIPVPCVQSNNWDNYSNVHGRLLIPLEEGQQVIRLNITGSSCNIDKITFRHTEVDENIQIAISSDPSPGVVSTPILIKVDASSPNSTIANVKLYLNNVLTKSLTQEPFEYQYTPSAKGTYAFTAIATDAEGKESKIAKLDLQVNNKRIPHKGIIEIPGVIEAENFDKGGEGFTYHDSDSQNEGTTAYRSDSEGVDIVSGNGGYVIGYTAANEWLEYTVNVKEGGKYAYKATASSGSTGSGFTLGLVKDGSIVSLCKVNVSQTANNSWDTYKVFEGNLSTRLEAGEQIMRITINGAYCNIDKIELKLVEGDGIEMVSADESADNSATYNTVGMKVNDNYKGIIIRNGKKMLKR